MKKLTAPTKAQEEALLTLFIDAEANVNACLQDFLNDREAAGVRMAEARRLSAAACDKWTACRAARSRTSSRYLF